MKTNCVAIASLFRPLFGGQLLCRNATSVPK